MKARQEKQSTRNAKQVQDKNTKNVSTAPAVEVVSAGDNTTQNSNVNVADDVLAQLQQIRQKLQQKHNAHKLKNKN